MKRFFGHLPACVEAFGFGHLAREREHQRDGVLGGGDRIAERRVHHHHALAPKRRNIDIVDADPGAADDLQIGRGIEDFLRHLGRAADGKAIIVADHRFQLFGGLAGDDIDVAATLGERSRGVGVHLVGNKYFGFGHVFESLKSGQAGRGELVSGALIVKAKLETGKGPEPAGVAKLSGLKRP
ncbi:MAG: hypothetical protein LKM31_06530 [Sphingobium sp.]|jgi:hypothetical protein|nr:hypothetical protein [Sphingobium sp.]